MSGRCPHTKFQNVCRNHERLSLFVERGRGQTSEEFRQGRSETGCRLRSGGTIQASTDEARVKGGKATHTSQSGLARARRRMEIVAQFLNSTSGPGSLQRFNTLVSLSLGQDLTPPNTCSRDKTVKGSPSRHACPTATKPAGNCCLLVAATPGIRSEMLYLTGIALSEFISDGSRSHVCLMLAISPEFGPLASTEHVPCYVLVPIMLDMRRN
ncbi:hypothetical protein BDZ45DRAFT_737579 [Acephala macrosclerotiorum]|nr:hypothetical protein BDZ45DRAFT_737579 [Acephala macrosclerotiorum]